MTSCFFSVYECFSGGLLFCGGGVGGERGGFRRLLYFKCTSSACEVDESNKRYGLRVSV